MYKLHMMWKSFIRACPGMSCLSLACIWTLKFPYLLQCLICFGNFHWFVRHCNIQPNKGLIWDHLNVWFISQYLNKDLIIQIQINSKGFIGTNTSTAWEKHTGARSNIKMLSYRCKNPHDKNKMMSYPFYLYDGILHTWKAGLDI